MKNFWERLNEAWCQFMHRGAMWPMHGEYRCRECLRVYSVPWAQSKQSEPLSFVSDRREPALQIAANNGKKGLLAA